MRHKTTFTANPAHRYTLPAGAIVQTAKFGRTTVDIWQDEPAAIYRGTPPQEVGKASLGLWRFVVHGEMSGCATSEEAARHLGERHARNSEANARTMTEAPALYPLTRHALDKEKAAFAAYLADIDSRFPVKG